MAVKKERPANQQPLIAPSPLRRYTTVVTTRVRNHPLISFFIALLLLLLLIILSNVITSPKATKTNNAPAAKQVAVYHIGSAPLITLPAKINKTGVIAIVAQSAGIVQNIDVAEGDSVKRGSTVVDLSSNYQGGDAAGIQS